MEDLYIPGNRNFNEETVRDNFTRLGWALGAFLLVAQGIASLVMVLCRNAAEAGNAGMIRFLSSDWAIWIISDAATYLVGLPVFLLLIHGIPKAPKPRRKRVTGKQFGGLLLVSYAALYCGNLVGMVITTIIGALRGEPVVNPLEAVITDTNPWITILFAVIIAPVMEEIVFRGILLRRLTPFGEPIAILTSALVFGLFHANIVQFPYAFLIGAVFAYTAIRTGSLVWTMLIHAFLNFVGSVLSLFVMESENIAATALFGLFILAMVVGGIVIFAKHRHTLHFEPGRLPLTEGQKRELLWKNSGMIAFLVASLVLMVITLI